MAMKPGMVSKKMRELVSLGHDPKSAAAMAISSVRKMAAGGEACYAEGGEVEPDMGDEMNRDLAELNDDSQPPDQVSNPEEHKEAMSFAEALRKQADSADLMSYAMGGLVQPDHSDEMQGTKPEVQSGPKSEEPMSMERVGMDVGKEKAMSGPGLTEEMAMAIADRKKKRRYA